MWRLVVLALLAGAVLRFVDLLEGTSYPECRITRDGACYQPDMAPQACAPGAPCLRDR